MVRDPAVSHKALALLPFSPSRDRISARSSFEDFEGIRIHRRINIYVPPSRMAGYVLDYKDPLVRSLELPNLSPLEQPKWTVEFDADIEF